MHVDCRSCGITHQTKAEAREIHDAVEHVHRWLRDRLALALAAVERGKPRDPKNYKWSIKP